MDPCIFEDRLYDLNVLLDRLSKSVCDSQNIFDYYRTSFNTMIDFETVINNYKSLLEFYIARNTELGEKKVVLQHSLSRLADGNVMNETDIARFQDTINNYGERIERNFVNLNQKKNFLTDSHERLIREREHMIRYLFREHERMISDLFAEHQQLSMINEHIIQRDEIINITPMNYVSDRNMDNLEKEVNNDCFCQQFLCESNTQTVDCPICCCEKVDGIRPECCESKQNICLSCLYTVLFEQYKKYKNSEPENISIDELLTLHYTCCFCRKTSCYKKYFLNY